MLLFLPSGSAKLGLSLGKCLLKESVSQFQAGLHFSFVFADSGKEDEWLLHTHVHLDTHTHTHTCTNTIMKPSEPALLVASLVTQLVKNPPAMWETWI